MTEEAKQEEVKQEEVKQEEVKQEEIKQEEVKQEEVKQEEVKKEEVKPKTLADFLLLILANQNVDEKISIKVNKDVLDVLKLIMDKMPHKFDEIEQNVSNIMKDGVINSKDVPDMLMLFSSIYELIDSLKHRKISKQEKVNICAELVKMLLHILIENHIIKVKEEDKILIVEQLDKLIDVSINLINLSSKLKTKGCLGKLFGKK